MPTDTELAYCAGVIDSDGTICFFHRTTRVRRGIRGAIAPEILSVIALAQVEAEAAELLSRLFGGKIQHYRQRKTSRLKHNKPLYRWRQTARKAITVIRLLLPHLRIKQAQARTALKLQDNIDNTRLMGRKLSAKTISERYALYEEMHKLNGGRRAFTAKLI